MTRINRTKILYPVILLMPSNALALAIAFGSSAWLKNERTSRTAIILAVSLFMASYNATKVPESDLYNYFLYSNILSESTFSEALRFSIEAPYYLGNWVFVGMLRLSFSSWVFFVSFVIFFFSLASVKKILETGGVHGPIIVAVIVLVGFSPLMFAQSGHLVRQYLAISLGMFAVARYMANERWVAILALAAMTHLSAAALFLIPIVGSLAPRFGKFSWTLTYGLPIASIGLARLLSEYAGFLQSIGVPSFIIYGLTRLGQREFHNLADFSFAGYVFVFASIAISGLFLLKGFKREIGGNSLFSNRLHILFSFQLILSVSILFLSILEFTEPAIRFSQFLFIITPIGLAYILQVHIWTRALLYVTAAAMPVIFLLYPSPWTYGEAVEVIFGPFHPFAFDGLFS